MAVTFFKNILINLIELELKLLKIMYLNRSEWNIFFKKWYFVPHRLPMVITIFLNILINLIELELNLLKLMYLNIDSEKNI